jgi:hypothetical protein
MVRNFPYPDRKFRKKRAEIFGTSDEAPYLCTPFKTTVRRKAERSLKEWKQQRIVFRNYGKVISCEKNRQYDRHFERMIVSVKQHLQWRV